jgi:hypothetical protein
VIVEIPQNQTKPFMRNLVYHVLFFLGMGPNLCCAFALAQGAISSRGYSGNRKQARSLVYEPGEGSSNRRSITAWWMEALSPCRTTPSLMLSFVHG